VFIDAQHPRRQPVHVRQRVSAAEFRALWTSHQETANAAAVSEAARPEPITALTMLTPTENGANSAN
jgi:hypothetical protein